MRKPREFRKEGVFPFGKQLRTISEIEDAFSFGEKPAEKRDVLQQLVEGHRENVLQLEGPDFDAVHAAEVALEGERRASAGEGAPGAKGFVQAVEEHQVVEEFCV